MGQQPVLHAGTPSSTCEKRTENAGPLPSPDVRPTDDPRLLVAPSRITAAGNGLFAVEKIPRDTAIVKYTGTLLSTAEAFRLDDKTYLMRLGLGKYVDGNPARSTDTNPDKREHVQSLACYLNDARPYNCYFVKRPEDGWADVVTLRDVEAGEELYVSYGKLYWTGHKLANLGSPQKKAVVTPATEFVCQKADARTETLWDIT
ncbi:unnamed protein product [Amoebophrya sp. A120]|nr:unnamed protein product [Amoebophrya sp. A120]|eukprot:GSA120T00002968001.1